MNEVTIDVETLRRDLIDYYGTAMFNASPLAIADLSRVESCSDEELVQIALENRIDLNNYIITNLSR